VRRGAHDPDEHLVVVDGADDAVLATARGPVAVEVEAQRPADASWVRGERSVEEVGDRDRTWLASGAVDEGGLHS
jgi:hypothetical protein